MAGEMMEEVRKTWQETIADLERKLDIAVKGLQFYANKENWHFKYDANERNIKLEAGPANLDSGSIAIETLKELGL